MKKEKKSKQRKILIVSAVLAVLIVVGGTFAWFTSSDEVTNRLTASNTYGVSIVESFSAPENWTPGQVVNKDVSVVNTGNVDAIVKATISSALTLTVQGTPESYAADNVATYVKLSTDEVKSLQAGGVLVCEAGTAVTDATKQNVGTDYTPSTTGLYVFDRNDETNAAKKYVGYYYVQDSSGGTAGTGTYYELAAITVTTNTPEYSATLVTTKSVDAEENGTTAASGKLSYDYTQMKDTSDPYIVVTYQAGSSAAADKDVKINIHLAKDWATNWTFDTTTKTFYYNKTVAAGTTSDKLIDSLELDDSVTKDAYIDFQYDLTINTDSIQVVTDEDGKQQLPTLTGWLGLPDTDKVTYANSGDTNKIATINWSISSTTIPTQSE